MAVQLSVAVRNGRLDSVETTVGASALLGIFSGSIPANCAAASSGTQLVTMSLPADWMAAASGGTKAFSGTWSGTGLAGAGTGTVAGYFRIFDTTGVTCGMQGTVTYTGLGGDLTINAPSAYIAVGQVVNVTSFTLTDANA